MKILLDECIPVDFRHLLPGYQAHSAQWARLKGKKNGELLRLAERAGYDVVLTADRGIQYEQNLASRKLAIVVMRSTTNRMKHLAPMADLVMGRVGDGPARGGCHGRMSAKKNVDMNVDTVR